MQCLDIKASNNAPCAYTLQVQDESSFHGKTAQRCVQCTLRGALHGNQRWCVVVVLAPEDHGKLAVKVSGAFSSPERADKHSKDLMERR